MLSHPDLYTSEFEIVHAHILHGFADLVRMQRGDPDALVESALMSDIDAPKTYRGTSHLLELAADRLSCPDFGMRLAQMQGGGLIGPLGDVMRSSRTFGDALQYACGHSYAHSPAARIVCNRRVDDDHLFVSHDLLPNAIARRAQLIEQILLLGNLVAIHMTGGKARAWRVHFCHEAVSSPSVYRRNFGCDVRFGQPRDGVIYTQTSLASRVVHHDAKAYRAITALLDARFSPHRAPFNAQVRWLVMRHLGIDDCSNERIAADMQVHPRTLHRKLAAESSSFQQIKDDIRREHMRYYLEHTDMHLAEISARIGFAEQSILTRSCHRWLGASPRVIRARARLSGYGTSQRSVSNRQAQSD